MLNKTIKKLLRDEKDFVFEVDVDGIEILKVHSNKYHGNNQNIESVRCEQGLYQIKNIKKVFRLVECE